MKNSKYKILKNITKYKNIILITTFLITFKDLYLPIYEKYIVEPILLKFTQSFFSDITLFLFVIILIIWTYCKIKIRYYIKKEYSVYCIIFLILCGTIRYNYNNQLLSTVTFSNVKYFDILFLVAIIPLILISFFYTKPIESVKSDSEFLNDDPSNIDLLNRKQKANQVSKLIRGNNSKSSLAIGVVGEWGTGKTTFMTYISDSFKDDKNYIVINFNSWLSISINSIISDFFNTVEENIRIHSIDISKEIKKYANNVLSINKNSTSDTILNLVNIIPEKSLSDNFSYLNTLLNTLNKKVVVIFDDIDRLQPNEVFDVLKLIRNTASFDAFNYIVGYDKKYLIASLEKNNIPFPEKYCEKIFLKEFPLLPITQLQINNYIKENIQKWFPNRNDEFENLFLDKNPYLNKIDIFYTIKTLRTAKRFLNELKISIINISEEIYLYDFILIKLLKFSYYDVYQLLFNKNIYLEIGSQYDNSRSRAYGLRANKRNKATLPLFVSFDISILKEDIIKLNQFNEEELDIISKICNYLFDDNHRSNEIKTNSIVYGNNYYRYFDDEISELDIKNSDFKKFMNASITEKKKIIDIYYEENRLFGLVLFIYKVNIYREINSKDKYEEFIETLFYIANLKPYNDKNLEYYGIDNNFLYNCINIDINFYINKLGYKDENEFKIFFRKIFYESKDYYSYEIQFLKFTIKNFGVTSNFNIPFNKKEIEEYFIYCFDILCINIKEMDEYFWKCYDLCFITNWEQTSTNSWGPTKEFIKQNKDKLLLEIIPKIYKDFLLSCIVPHDIDMKLSKHVTFGLSNDFPLKIFSTHENFINYLESDIFKNSMDQSNEYFNEFLEFAKEVVKNKKFIEFDFKYIDINQRVNTIERTTVSIS